MMSERKSRFNPEELRHVSIQCRRCKTQLVIAMDEKIRSIEHCPGCSASFDGLTRLIATGSKSLGSVRGSLDAILVHAGHEFRIWSPKWKRPTVCHFDRSILSTVTAHLKQEVEVIGELHRNARGEPVIMKVTEFIPLEPIRTLPRIEDMRGLLSDLYGGKSLQAYMDELRNG